MYPRPFELRIAVVGVGARAQQQEEEEKKEGSPDFSMRLSKGISAGPAHKLSSGQF